MINTPPITEMLGALIEAGMTQQAIADEIGVTQSTVFRALNGTELRYCSGKALERLYLERGAQEQERRRKERRATERRQAERRA